MTINIEKLIPKEPVVAPFYASIPGPIAAFFALIGAVYAVQDSLIANAKTIKEGAKGIARIQAEEMAITYPELTATTPSHTEIVKFMNELQALGAEKENLQKMELLLRQSEQVAITKANTSVNLMEQSASLTSNLLSVLGAAYDAIQQMTPINPTFQSN